MSDMDTVSQNKGNFYIWKDGSVTPDNRDFNALSNAWFADQKNPRHYDGFTELTNPDIEFLGCLWEIDGGVKACVTDREKNMIELLGVSIEVAASVLKAAKDKSNV